jgi:hypothetical protein
MNQVNKRKPVKTASGRDLLPVQYFSGLFTTLVSANQKKSPPDDSYNFLTEYAFALNAINPFNFFQQKSFPEWYMPLLLCDLWRQFRGHYALPRSLYYPILAPKLHVEAREPDMSIETTPLSQSKPLITEVAEERVTTQNENVNVDIPETVSINVAEQ